MDVETVPIVSGMVDSPPNRSRVNTFRLVERADRFPSTPIEHSLATPSALRGEAQMVSPAHRTERVSFDHSRVLCAWICLLLQSAQPRLASAILESVILALSSLPGTIGQNFLRLRRAEALHLILLIHRGPGPPLSREAAGVRHPVGGSHLSFKSRFCAHNLWTLVCALS